MATDTFNTAKSAFSGSGDWNSGGYSFNDIDNDPIGKSGSAASDVIGRWWNNISGKTASAQAEFAESQRNRDWQEYMSNTSYQRMVADMKAAGLNPAMMDGGSGASTPQGSAGHIDSSGNGLGSFLAGMARSAIGAIMTKKMIQAGAADHGEYRKMMSEYYSAKNALAQDKNQIARVHESKNRGYNMAYSNWKG